MMVYLPTSSIMLAGVEEPILDDWVRSGDSDQGGWWTGKTVFTYQDDGNDDGDHEVYSLAAKKKMVGHIGLNL